MYRTSVREASSRLLELIIVLFVNSIESSGNGTWKMTTIHIFIHAQVHD